ncbi:tetratricopeptide repeat protein [bacterium]|nr:MAG: tetratricopeptide repeat protein [bacterium]
MQKTKNPVHWIFAMSMLIGLGHIFTANTFAQKSDKEIRKEYRTSVSQYIQSLDESFAYRYLDNEVILLDLISSIRGEFKFRKDKKALRASSESKIILPMSKDSIRVRLKTIRDNLDLMKKKNYLMPGYTNQSGLNELHMEYQRLYGMDYELTRAEALGVRNHLLKSGENDQVRTLFERQLQQAFKRFKEASYTVAAIEFQDILTTYKTYFTELDDITFYLAESYFRMKDFGNAEENYYKVVTDYPSSPFVERCLFNLVVMNYIQTDRNRMQKYFAEFESKVTPNNKNDLRYNQPFYLAGLTLFKTSDYSASIAILKKIPNTSRYYYPAKYVMGHAYANLETYPEALEQFEAVVKLEANNRGFSVELQKQLKDIAKLKIAFIKFELTTNGQKLKAVYPYVKNIPAASNVHDAALLVLSWSALKDNDIDTARVFVDSLLRTYPASDYYYEAKTLLGNIQVLDPTLSDKDRELLAVDAFNYVAGATEAKYLADQFVSERDSSFKVLGQLGEARTIARLRNDSLAFVNYDRLYDKLAKATTNNGFMKAITTDTRSAGYYQTMSNLISKIRVAEGQLKNAEETKDQKEINKLNKELSGYLNEFQAIGGEKFLDQVYVSSKDSVSGATTDTYADVETQSYFSLHKVPRSLSEIDARNKSLNALKDKISREKELIQNQLITVDNMMVTAKEKNKESSLIKLQYERKKLADLYYRLSDYEVLLYTEDPIENYVDLDVWGDFASYGRNNITYVINTTKNETIKDLARAASQIDKILLTRKKNYESRIAAIEEEIKLKEQEIRDKEMQEMRVSQKQFFEKEYFQAKASEKPEIDPFDYNDLVPEVVVIPQDTLPAEPVNIPQEEEESTEEPAAIDTAVKSGTDEMNNEMPSEKIEADSTSNNGGGGQNDEGEFSQFRVQSTFENLYAVVYWINGMTDFNSSYLTRNQSSLIES